MLPLLPVKDLEAGKSEALSSAFHGLFRVCRMYGFLTIIQKTQILYCHESKKDFNAFNLVPDDSFIFIL